MKKDLTKLVNIEFQNEEKLKKIEKRKLNALGDQNPREFYKACDAGGFSGEEDSLLYDLGNFLINGKKVSTDYNIYGKKIKAKKEHSD